MSGAPLLIHHHLPKTGGTSLRAVVRESYGPGEVAELYRPLRRARIAALSAGRPFDRAAWYRDWYRGLSAEQRARIRCVASHTSNDLAPALDVPWRAFCVLRDPVERVWSLYRFSVDVLARSAEPSAELRPGVAAGRTIVREGWSLADLYRELGGGGPRSSPLHGRFAQFFNGQARSVLGPWRDPAELEYWPGLPARGAELEQVAGALLAERYLVGVYERFDSSLRRFADSFGWGPVSVPHLNRSGPREPLDPATRGLVLSFNRLDASLHARFGAAAADPPGAGPCGISGC